MTPGPARDAARARCCRRATRSTRTRAAPPRTRRRRRSGSSIPPAYAATDAGARDSLTLRAWRCAARAHRRRRGALPAVAAARDTRPAERRVAFAAARSPSSPLEPRAAAFAERRPAAAVRLAAEQVGPARSRSRCAWHNTTASRRGREPRRGARRRACSRRCRCCASAPGASPRRWTTARPLRSENTFPVLATADDDVLLGAADHAARPPAARAREPGRPVRRHRDRGGAAAARARAQRRRARVDRARRSRRARHDRARRGGHAG